MPKPKKPQKLNKFLIFPLILGGLFFNFSSSFAITADHLVISQIQITGGSGKTTNDFIEIYNPTNSDIDLQGFRLVKRTKTGTTDTLIKSWTKSAWVKAGGYFLWANSDFLEIAVTPNATTTASIAADNGVALRNGPNNTGVIVDSVAWGEAANAFVEGAAFPTNPEADMSLERQNESNNNAQDFSLVSSHPRNSESLASSSPPPPPQAAAAPSPQAPPAPPPSSPPPAPSPLPSPAAAEADKQPSTLRISEILPDPFGDDTKAEFIEIENYGTLDLDLQNWAISDAKRRYDIAKSYLVPSLGYFALYLEGTGISLNNTGDEIALFEPQGTVVSQLSYGKAPEGQSYVLTPEAQTYEWTTSPTPGQENRFTLPPPSQKETSRKPTESPEPQVLSVFTPSSTGSEEMVAAEAPEAPAAAQTKPFWSRATFWLILAPFLGICYIGYRKFKLLKERINQDE